MGSIVSQSTTGNANLTGPGACGDGSASMFQGRCGYGPRMPLLVISPYAKVNYVDHGVTDQASILRFIEDNWNLGRIGAKRRHADIGYQSPCESEELRDDSGANPIGCDGVDQLRRQALSYQWSVASGSPNAAILGPTSRSRSCSYKTDQPLIHSR